MEPVSGLPAIEIGSLQFPSDLVWSMVITASESSWTKRISIDSAAVRRIFVTLGPPGEYAVTADSGPYHGYLVSGDHEKFQIGNTKLWLGEARLSSLATDTATPRPGGLDKGTKIAIIVAPSVVGLVLIAVGGVCLFRWLKKRRIKEELSQSMGKLVWEEGAAPFF
jgi:hypothetical protein